MTKLEIYSLGIVAKDKDRQSSMISVLPIEELPLTDGDINSTVDMSGNVSINGLGESLTDIKKGSLIEAKWICLGGSNRALPPDVKRRETVLIFKYANTGEYYWTTIFNEPTIRRQETLVTIVGNEPDDGEILGVNNSHWVMISSHDKKVNLHTSDNNGEACGYDVVFDLAEGVLDISDTTGNDIQLRSIEGVLEASINEKVIVNTPVIETNGDEVIINAKNNVTINTDACKVNTSTAVVEASSSIDLSTPAFTVNSSSMTFNGDSVFNGAMKVTGGILTPGGLATSGAPAAGAASISGTLSVSGNSDLANVTANNISASNCSCPNLD